RLEQWETAGDLYQKVEQPADAERAYRRAVTARLEKSEYLDAARLLEYKIQATDEAYEVLCGGWPNSAVARKCLDASFELLERHQRYDEAVARVKELTDELPVGGRGAELAGGLAKLASDSAHAAVRATAAEHTRQIVSRRLARALPSEAQS